MSPWLWLTVAALLAVVVIDAVRGWRAGEPDELERDWNER